MNKKKIRVFCTAALVLLAISPTSNAAAEGKVIQKEQISYEKCLKIITTSEEKLSMDPVIEDVSDQKRVAVFKLIDGKLTITCDGIEGNVTVSTSPN